MLLRPHESAVTLGAVLWSSISHFMTCNYIIFTLLHLKKSNFSEQSCERFCKAVTANWDKIIMDDCIHIVAHRKLSFRINSLSKNKNLCWRFTRCTCTFDIRNKAKTFDYIIYLFFEKIDTFIRIYKKDYCFMDGP